MQRFLKYRIMLTPKSVGHYRNFCNLSLSLRQEPVIYLRNLSRT